MRKLVGPCLLLLALAACSDDSGPTSPDAGPADSGTITLPDAGNADVGPRPDGGGPADIGASDPDTIFQDRVEIRGLPMYLHLMGTKTSTMPPLVLLHTGPAVSHEYLPDHMRFLVPGRLLVFYDMRASGLTSFGSADSSTITAAQDVDDLDGVVDYVLAESGASKVDLFGHGWGGGIAALYSAKFPQRVSRLILSSPFPANIFQHRDLREEEQARLTQEDRERMFRLQQPECMRNMSECYLRFWALFGPKSMCEPNREMWTELTFIHGEVRAQWFRDEDLRNQAYDWEPEIAQIQAPTWVFSGPCDTIGADVAETYATLIGSLRAHRIFANSGHFPMVEEKALFNAALRSALTYP